MIHWERCPPVRIGDNDGEYRIDGEAVSVAPSVTSVTFTVPHTH
jgi:hypothetical protein